MAGLAGGILLGKELQEMCAGSWFAEVFLGAKRLGKKSPHVVFILSFRLGDKRRRYRLCFCGKTVEF